MLNRFKTGLEGNLKKREEKEKERTKQALYRYQMLQSRPKHGGYFVSRPLFFFLSRCYPVHLCCDCHSLHSFFFSTVSPFLSGMVYDFVFEDKMTFCLTWSNRCSRTRALDIFTFLGWNLEEVLLEIQTRE